MILANFAIEEGVLYWMQTKLFITLLVQSKRWRFHLNSQLTMTLCCFEKSWQLRSPQCIVIDSVALCMARRHVHCVDYSQAKELDSWEHSIILFENDGQSRGQQPLPLS